MLNHLIYIAFKLNVCLDIGLSIDLLLCLIKISFMLW